MGDLNPDEIRIRVQLHAHGSKRDNAVSRDADQADDRGRVADAGQGGFGKTVPYLVEEPTRAREPRSSVNANIKVKLWLPSPPDHAARVIDNFLRR